MTEKHFSILSSVKNLKIIPIELLHGEVENLLRLKYIEIQETKDVGREYFIIVNASITPFGLEAMEEHERLSKTIQIAHDANNISTESKEIAKKTAIENQKTNRKANLIAIWGSILTFLNLVIAILALVFSTIK